MSEIIFSGEIPGAVAEETLFQKEFSMVRRHLHNSIELYFLLEGERYYFIEQDIYHVKPGMAILINRNQIHKTSIVNNCIAHHRFLLQLDTPVLQSFFSMPEGLDIKTFGEKYWGVAEFSPEDWQQVLSTIEMLKKEIQRNDSDGRTMAQLFVMQLMILFARNRWQQAATLSKNQAQDSKKHTSVHQTVHEIALYLQNHSSEACSLNEIAARHYISCSYLTRIFKSVTGFTITEYLAICRVRKAKILLDETDLSVTEISGRTGFGNVNYFERVFKRTTDLTPLQYRKRNR